MNLTEWLEESEYSKHFTDHFYEVEEMLERREELIKERGRYENAQHSGEFDFVIEEYIQENGHKPSEADRCLLLNAYTNPLYDEVGLKIRDLEGDIKAKINRAYQKIVDKLRGDWDTLKFDIFHI